jgi:hypothetical protein
MSTGINKKHPSPDLARKSQIRACRCEATCRVWFVAASSSSWPSRSMQLHIQSTVISREKRAKMNRPERVKTEHYNQHYKPKIVHQAIDARTKRAKTEPLAGSGLSAGATWADRGGPPPPTVRGLSPWPDLGQAPAPPGRTEVDRRRLLCEDWAPGWIWAERRCHLGGPRLTTTAASLCRGLGGAARCLWCCAVGGHRSAPTPAARTEIKREKRYEREEDVVEEIRG